MIKCKFCDKQTNNKYCSNICKWKVINKLNGMANVKKHLLNRTGVWSAKSQEKAHNTNKKNGTSWCYDKKIMSKGGKNNVKNNREKKLGWFSDESYNKSQATLRKLGVSSFYDEKRRLLLCKKAGAAAVKHNRKNKIGCFFNKELNRQIRDKFNKNITIFNNINFDSLKECEIAMCLYYQLIINKLIFRNNVHVYIGTKEYDFLICKYKLFLEFHPVCINISTEEYYKQRRDNLDKNGHKDYNLVVIQ